MSLVFLTIACVICGVVISEIKSTLTRELETLRFRIDCIHRDRLLDWRVRYKNEIANYKALIEHNEKNLTRIEERRKEFESCAPNHRSRALWRWSNNGL